MWRPDEWSNPYAITITPSHGADFHDYKAYEAGADAMLNVLRSQSFRELTDNFTWVGNTGIHGKGKLVFIPDEED